MLACYVIITNVCTCTMTVILFLFYVEPGPLPFKRSRLEDVQHSNAGPSTAGPSSASGLDTKLSEWKTK